MNATRLRRTASTTVRYIPGMYPNAPKRNLVVLITYVLLLSMALGVVQLLAEVEAGVLAVDGATIAATHRRTGPGRVGRRPADDDGQPRGP